MREDDDGLYRSIREPLPLNPQSSIAPANAAAAGLMVEQHRGSEAGKIALVGASI
jgi:hypothetical protein